MRQILIHYDQKTKELGDLFGLFFEDINHAADGGLYAELIQNRSFEFNEIDNKDYTPFTAWEKSQHLKWEISTENPANSNNPHHLIANACHGDYFYNLGFGAGIPVKKDEKYILTLRARAINKPVTIGVSLTIDNGESYSILSDIKEITLTPGAFEYHETVLTANGTNYENTRLIIVFSTDGAADFDTISLFPEKTFCNRKNGLRPDLAEALRVMKPKFLRFPGGCLVHDGSLNSDDRNSLYRWKNTIGPVFDRPARRNNWGYNQTLGLGYFEYFLLCEDLNTEPLPVLPAAFNPHTGEGVPVEEIGIWVQEALDLIDFANGDESTAYGKIRHELGHPEPFNLKYLAIGNEEIGQGFFDRYPFFHDAIRAAHPEIKLINSAGPFAVGEGNDAGWASAKTYGSDLVDEHYYMNPYWFLANMHHYDDYDQNGPGVFLGEYASWDNTYYNAIVEAAYMTHLQKTPVVKLACYAPLFCNTDYKNWTPDMIFFDGQSMTLTPNYYVQKLFMLNQGTHELATEAKGLDLPFSLLDNDSCLGEFSLQGNDVKGTVTNLRICDENSEEILYEQLKQEITSNEEITIFDIQASNYAIEFDFERLEGKKGLNIRFGKSDNVSILWEFGGWQNFDSNLQFFTGKKGATISHRIFHVEDIHYKLRIEVYGRRVRTFINGELYNNCVIPQPEIEDVYYCASCDENGDTIAKIVNLAGEDKDITIKIDGLTKIPTTSSITELAGAKLFDKKIEPAYFKEKSTSSFTYEFKKHSVTIIRFS